MSPCGAAAAMIHQHPCLASERAPLPHLREVSDEVLAHAADVARGLELLRVEAAAHTQHTGNALRAGACA